MAVSFATAFSFAGKLYVLDGDNANSTNPNEEGNPGINDVNLASALNGDVGTWAPTNATVKKRKKHVTWNAFGQVIDAEGVYDGLGSLELERTVVNADSTLASWNGMTKTPNQINANVYGATALVSPLQSPAATPRFLLLGGESISLLPAGQLSSAVYYNSAP
jgi:hypothetical protein